MSLVKVYKPTTPARRKTSVVNYKKVLTTNEPYKKLLLRKKNSAGRNNRGVITIRHRGGGSRKLVRQVDFKRDFKGGFKVNTIEYDPNRSAFVCLVTELSSGIKYYTLYTKGMQVGQKYNKSDEIKEGDQAELRNMPVGSFVSQIELNPKQGAKIVRSAGTYAKLTAKEEKYVTLKLPSGEIRKFLGTCKAVLGRIGNQEHELVRIGKAGRVRRKGIRPTVRGKVMNPVDHPHGGGEGKTSGGRPSVTPWGRPTKVSS